MPYVAWIGRLCSSFKRASLTEFRYQMRSGNASYSWCYFVLIRLGNHISEKFKSVSDRPRTDGRIPSNRDARMQLKNQEAVTYLEARFRRPAADARIRWRPRPTTHRRGDGPRPQGRKLGGLIREQSDRRHSDHYCCHWIPWLKVVFERSDDMKERRKATFES